MASFFNLQQLGVKDRVRFHSMALNDFRSVLQVLTKVRPDEIYNLAGQSSVGLSFDHQFKPLASRLSDINDKNALWKGFLQHFPERRIVFNQNNSSLHGETVLLLRLG